ncbi:MAG: cache domain-containing protein [Desulfobacterales bacterium]
MGAIRPFRDLKIRYKLLLAYSAVFILCLSLGSLTIYAFVRQTIRANIESELKNTTAGILNMVRTAAATSIKNHLRAVAEKNLEIAVYFHRQVQEGRLNTREAQARVRDVLLSQTIGTTGYIYCINNDGVIVIHPREALLGVDLSEYGFIREQLTRKSGYLEYDWMNPGEDHARPKALYMTYFEPWDWIISVSSYREEFRELVNPEDFRDSILSIRFGTTGYSYIMDEKGNMVVHPAISGNYLHVTDRDGRAFIREILERRDGTIVYKWENPGESRAREKLVIFHHIPEYQWIVASSSYTEEFYAPLKTVRMMLLATVLASVVLALPITFRLSSSITNPIRELMDHFSSGAAGNSRVRVRPRSNDEVGVLARYFNQFMERLETSSESLNREIAERKKAEAAIRKSEAKYRELVENANSIILRMNPLGEVTFFNEFAQSFFGYPESDILGRNMLDSIIPEKDAWGKDLSSILQDIRTNPEAFPTFECEARRRNGERVWISWTNRAIRDRDGRIVECLCIGNDVTAARLAEQETNQMRLYLRSIIDSMPSSLVGVDRSGRIRLLNREAEKSAEGSLLGRPLEEVFPFLKERMGPVRQAIQERKIRKLEKVVLEGDPGPRFLDIMVYPLFSEILEGAVIRVDDITRRVRMEDVMVQTEKMLSVGGLAAGMAHEINNPLSGMLQSTQNILRRIDPAIPKNRRVADECGVELTRLQEYLERRQVLKFIDDIRSSGERATRTVAHMLHFSRRSDSQLEPARIDRLVEATIELAAHDYDLRKKFDFRKIRIERDFEPELPEVPCVPTEIEQVLLNLLRNAAQALRLTDEPMPDPRITVRLRSENGYVRIDVEDNGPGMDEKTRKRAFEPFFTTKDVGIGTGLGLSVSYFIIANNHQGKITVESAPGRGAVFSIRLPVETSGRSK